MRRTQPHFTVRRPPALRRRPAERPTCRCRSSSSGKATWMGRQGRQGWRHWAGAAACRRWARLCPAAVRGTARSARAVAARTRRRPAQQVPCRCRWHGNSSSVRPGCRATGRTSLLQLPACGAEAEDPGVPAALTRSSAQCDHSLFLIVSFAYRSRLHEHCLTPGSLAPEACSQWGTCAAGPVPTPSPPKQHDSDAADAN